MNQHSAVKAALQNQLDELLLRAAEIERSLNTPGNADWAENAAESEDDEVLSEVGDLTRKEINEIRLAINMIDTGRYGKCTACGQAISKERLAAIPHATKCIKCA